LNKPNHIEIDFLGTQYEQLTEIDLLEISKEIQRIKADADQGSTS